MRRSPTQLIPGVTCEFRSCACLCGTDTDVVRTLSEKADVHEPGVNLPHGAADASSYSLPIALPGASSPHKKRMEEDDAEESLLPKDIPEQETASTKIQSFLSWLFKAQKPAPLESKLGSSISRMSDGYVPSAGQKQKIFKDPAPMPEALEKLIKQHSASAWTVVKTNLANDQNTMKTDDYFKFKTSELMSSYDRLLRALENPVEFSDFGIEHLGSLMQKYNDNLEDYPWKQMKKIYNPEGMSVMHAVKVPVL